MLYSYTMIKHSIGICYKEFRTFAKKLGPHIYFIYTKQASEVRETLLGLNNYTDYNVIY